MPGILRDPRDSQGYRESLGILRHLRGYQEYLWDMERCRVILRDPRCHQQIQGDSERSQEIPGDTESALGRCGMDVGLDVKLESRWMWGWILDGCGVGVRMDPLV